MNKIMKYMMRIIMIVIMDLEWNLRYWNKLDGRKIAWLLFQEIKEDYKEDFEFILVRQTEKEKQKEDNDIKYKKQYI